MSSAPAPDTPAHVAGDEALQLQPLQTTNEDQTKEIAPFLRSLRRMLDRESDAILCWTADGKAFEIHDMEVMTSYILPKYFKHSKYTSFQRQLNYFNFRKWTKSRAVVCTFSNAFFVRDQPDLTWRITRKRGLSDARSADGGAASDGGEVSPRTPKASPKPRAAVAVATSTSAGATKSVTLKREQSGSKRKASSSASSSSSSSQAKKTKLSSSVVKIESVAAPGVVSPTDPTESLEWVDTLYPSLEALEAECSVNSTSMQFSSYAHPSDQVAFAWPQYFPSSSSSSTLPGSAAESVDRFRAQPSSYEAYFVPTVVQTRCVAL